MMNVVRMRQRNIVLQNISGVNERVNKLGAIARPSIEKLLFLKGYKNELIRLVLPHFNFWPEKCYYVFISTGCQNNS